MPALLVCHCFGLRQHRFPAGVIRTRAISILREPAMTRSADRELSPDKLDQSAIENPLGEQYSLRAAFVTAAVEKFEGADAVGL